MRLKINSLGLLLLSLILCSCSKVIYLDNMKPEVGYETVDPELKIRKGDRLTIVVNSRNAEMTAPFNVMSGTSYHVSGNGEISAGQNTNATTGQGGYIVDHSGFIDFPVLGQLFVETLTSSELAAEIKSQLIENKYVEDPLVSVEIRDAKITVMGEVRNNGALLLKNKGLNLMEAITLSGGLTENAAPYKISVIRMQDGKRQLYETDIRSTELFDSPCFALQQDDIVYVRPRSARMTYKEDRAWRYWGVVTGLVSTVVSLLILVK